MTFEPSPYLIPYGLSVLISFSVGAFAWRRREVTGGLYFALLAFSEALWTCGYIFELGSTTVYSKLFWDNLQVIPSISTSVFMLLFALTYTNHPQHEAKWLQWGGFIGGCIWFALVVTNDAHHFMRSDVWLTPSEPFGVLEYDFNLGYLLFTVYLYIPVLLGMWYLAKEFFRGQRFYRRQILIIASGFGVPFFVGIFIFSAAITVAGQRDLTPISFSIGNLIVAFGLFRYRLFDIMPIARHQIVDSMKDMVVVLDNQNRIVDINPAMEQLIGFTAREVIGEHATKVYSRWSDLLAQYQDALDISTEISIQRDNEPYYFDLRLSAIRDKQGNIKGRVVVIRDINQQKHIEHELQERGEALERLNQELKEANESLKVLGNLKDEFVSNVSHELRTPLASLKINQELIQLKPDNTPVYVERMERETSRLEKIIEDLLRLSRLDQNRVEFEPELCNINNLVREYVEDRRTLADQKHIDLKCQPFPDLPLAEVDWGLMGQALGILLTNAINYTPPNGKITVKTQQQVVNGKIWIGFSVIDNGMGISPSDQPHLFERFFRGQAGLTSGQPGTGLGLPIAKEIITRHQGRIEVESKGIMGEGTIFHIWLPAPVPDAIDSETLALT